MVNKSFLITFFYFVSVLLMFSSCATLPISQSKALSENDQESFVRFYDKENNIKYGVANNDSVFYLQAEFNDPRNLVKILHGGITIYFDKEGKKKKDCSLKLEKTDGVNSNLLMRQGDKEQGQLRQVQNIIFAIDKSYEKAT
jgi:hypothetical protein